MSLQATNRIIESYTACCVQAYWEVYNPNLRGEFEGEMFKKRNLQRMCGYIDACFLVDPFPRPVKLVCFPEFSIGGMYNARTTTEEVKKYHAVTMPGPETDVLAAKAREHGIYIAAGNPENDPLIPDSFFITAFIINPEGKIIYKYRKLNQLFGCNPHDILDKYVNPVTGKPDFFPVVDTKIGKLACFICADLRIPEIPKIFALKGAEVLCHLSTPPGRVRETVMVRANDNTIYIVEENWAARVLTTEKSGDTCIITNVDTKDNCGHSMVIDYRGDIVAEANGTAPQLVFGDINIMALRKERNMYKNEGTGKGDSVALTRTELYAPFYNRTIFPPNQVLKEGPMKHPNDESVTKRRQQAVKNRKRFYDFYSEDEAK